MACNCGKGSARQTYTVTTSTGETVKGLSEGAAKLLVMKRGGSRTPEPVK